MVVKSKTALVCEELYFWHDNGSAALEYPSGGYYQPMSHVETPETKRRFKNLLEVSGLADQLQRIRAVNATEEQVLRFHTKRMLDELRQASAKDGSAPFGDGCVCSKGSYEIAMLSAGGAITAFHSVLDGDVKNAYCLNRPPGHHALADMSMGFCLLANIPIAIHDVFKQKKAQRIAVVDWDVHHGNGTEAAFIDSADVLTISIHQDGNYPLDTGATSVIGEGAGEGYNINIPLPPGSGFGAYNDTMQRVIVPALTKFQPDMIVVACGFDASIYDPLGRQMLYSKAYANMTKSLMYAADDLCGGRLVMTHEGGYSEAYVPFCGLSVIEALSGISTEVIDPCVEAVEGFVHQATQAVQKDVIDNVCAIHNL